jgi:hypothetical protein
VNATATTGTNQAILLAAFTLPVANAAPATPSFLNMIGLMLSSPNQIAPQVAPAAKTAVNPWNIAASPAQIADAMIRSMLGSPAPAVPVPTNLPADNLAVSAHISAPPTENSNQTAPSAPGVPMPAVPVETIVISAPPAATPSAGDSKGNVASTTTPQPVPSAPAPLANPEMKVAFSAILTPLKDTPAISAAGSQIAPSPEPSALVVPTAENPQPQAAVASMQATSSQITSTQVTPEQAATQPNGDSLPGGDTPSQQKNDSPETPAKSVTPASETKIKSAAQQDDNAAPAAPIAHPADAQPFTAAPPADSTRSIAATQSSATIPEATPYSATAEALRTTESSLAAAPQLRTGAAQEISIRIAPPDSPAVDLRVIERAGQVHVDVRTSDSAMQTSLRQDLGTLTNSLERAGYHTETFTPSSALGRAASSAQTGNHENQQDPSQNRGGAGDFSGGRRQQQQQKRPGTWLEELEEQK